MITIYKGIDQRNYLVGFSFHPDIDKYLYYVDSPKKNYEFTDIFQKLKIIIFSGNMDSGVNIYSNEEPSALYTSFKVVQPHRWSIIGKVPYHPRYRALNPYQRYEFLQVLVNPYRKDIKLGYLYLLLYCLERRLSEGQEEVIDAITKLADFHGGKFKHSVDEMLRKYNLWKSGSLFPQNARVYNNYTLYFGCYDSNI